RCEYTIRYQMAEIDRLRAVVKRQEEELTQLLAWIDGDSDALVVLQRTYMDPRTSTSDRVKACAAAVPYERSKVSVQIRVGPSRRCWTQFSSLNCDRRSQFGPGLDRQ